MVVALPHDVNGNLQEESPTLPVGQD